MTSDSFVSVSGRCWAFIRSFACLDSVYLKDKFFFNKSEMCVISLTMHW